MEFPELGQGAFRTTYDLGDGTVVKICRGDWCAESLKALHYRCHCLREAERWASAGEAARIYLAPVIDSGLHWVRMVKADGTVAALIHPNKWTDTLQIVYDGLTRSGVYISDISIHNVGIFTTGPRVIDFAL
jgi:hypothetical protein